jgi:hypothetical protein
MWLAMRTHEEIAAAIGYSRQAIGDFIEKSALARNGEHAVSGDTPDFGDADSDADDEDSNSLDMHLRCFTLEEIAKVEEIDHATAHRVLCKILDPEKCTKPTRALVEHAAEYEPALYNVWKQQTKSDRAILVMWLRCHAQEEIAEAAGCVQQAIVPIVDGLTNSVLENQNSKSAASHAAEFEPMLYNAFKQQTKSGLPIARMPIPGCNSR